MNGAVGQISGLYTSLEPLPSQSAEVDAFVPFRGGDCKPGHDPISANSLLPLSEDSEAVGETHKYSSMTGHRDPHRFPFSVDIAIMARIIVGVFHATHLEPMNPALLPRLRNTRSTISRDTLLGEAYTCTQRRVRERKGGRVLRWGVFT